MSAEVATSPEVLAHQAEEEAHQILTQAKALVVTTDEEYRQAGAAFADIKARIKAVEAKRVEITGPMNAALKAVNEMFKRPKEALEAALRFYEAPMLRYQREKDAERRAAEDAARQERERMEREAREKAEAELRHLEEIRQAQDQAQQEAAQAANPVAAMLKAEEAQRLAQEAAEAKAAAEAAIRQSVAIEAPVVYVPKATAAGTALRKNWKFRIVDAAAIPRQYLIPDEKAIGEVARSLKDKAEIPGVEFYEDLSIGGR